MAVFTYVASNKQREEHVESGTVVARTEAEAKEKLKKYQLGNVRLKRIGGIQGFFKAFVADVK